MVVIIASSKRNLLSIVLMSVFLLFLLILLLANHENVVTRAAAATIIPTITTSSPIFPNHEILDPKVDWIDLKTRNFTKGGDRSTESDPAHLAVDAPVIVLYFANCVRFPAISAMSAAKHDMIQKLKQKVHYGKDIIEYSIIKSRCIKTSDRSGIFKHLFASLELATNSDRDEKIGGELDNKAPQLPTY